ncbi:MAG: peptide chain release factor 1 [Planctomycetes bacterium]|nr:peptide chain release factor 1 [Planctomycetota bacterium]MBU1517435.1 peptide chain release factor 1 [Planctomycetota bacterium]MBU2457650.1 peptide chain release factor 1 [Planctomycetota bacterium]
MSETNITVTKKLDELDGRYAELEKQLNDPAITMDSAKLIAISKEQGKIRAVVTKYRGYKKLITEIQQTQAILDDASTEEELKQLAAEDLAGLKEKTKSLFEQIKDSLVMSDDEAVGSVIVEIRAGTGGDEAALFARDLYNMYTHYAEKQKWKVELLDFSTNEIGGFREVIFNVKGLGVWMHLGYEGGGHRVQRVPETETQGRVHTSAVTVAVLPEPEEIDIYINPADVSEFVCRAGGPGGQSVNKINSAVKLEHKPTRITVNMREDKSQHKNRAKAWRLLRSRVYDHYQSIERAKRDKKRKTMIGSGDRSEKIRTYNYPQNRVTDHRINLSIYNLDKIMDGDIENLVAGLIEYDKKLRLESL